MHKIVILSPLCSSGSLGPGQFCIDAAKWLWGEERGSTKERRKINKIARSAFFPSSSLALFRESPSESSSVTTSFLPLPRTQGQVRSTYGCTHTHLHTHIHTCTNTHLHKHTLTRTHTHSHSITRTHTCTNTHSHALVHSHTRTH